MEEKTLLILWIALAVVFAVAEAATAQIVTLWFVIGAIGALIANALHATALVQGIVFVGVSLLTLVIARPFFKRVLKAERQPTNLDMCIGQTAVVTEGINNTLETGAAKIRGNVWTARSESGEEIPAGASVTVVAIEGVKLIVKTK